MNDSTSKCSSNIKQGKNKGNQCCNKAKYGEYCGVHNPKEFIHLSEILPNNLSSNLSNSSYEGLLKIKKIIIENWLKTHSKEELIENKIPVSKNSYDLLLPKFNNESVVLDMIFKISEKSKKEFTTKDTDTKIKFSSKMPLFPISLEYYNFLCKVEPNDEIKRSINYQNYKNFIVSQWVILGEKIHSDGKIYIKRAIYDSIKSYILDKINQFMKSEYCNQKDLLSKISVTKWKNFIMKDIFVTTMKPKKISKTPSPRRRSKSSIPEPKAPKFYEPKAPKFYEPQIPKIPSVSKTFSIPKKKDVKKELTKLFPDKDIELFIKVISIDSDVYAKNIKSKRDIHELYLQFHPDKCDNSEVVIKLCNLFCSKVENIKKCFERNTKRDIAHSPIKVRGNEMKNLEELI
jgi:hypothetical protein